MRNASFGWLLAILFNQVDIEALDAKTICKYLEVTAKIGILSSNWQESCAQQRETVRHVESHMYCIRNAFAMWLLSPCHSINKPNSEFTSQTKPE